MRTKGLPQELERRRRLAVRRYLDGYAVEEIAAFLGVSERSVQRWIAAFLRQGPPGLAARSGAGRHRKLTDAQERLVLNWLRQSPAEHGFANELWTAARVGELIRREWGIPFNRRYLSAWLRERDITPQKPQRVPRERDPDQIAHWLATDWPRIKKRSAGCKPIWRWSMRAACCWRRCCDAPWPRGARRRC